MMWQLTRSSWEVPQLQLSRHQDPSLVKAFLDVLKRDILSEFDSASLYAYLHQRTMAGSLTLCSDLQEYLDIWLAEERKHYEALSLLYQELLRANNIHEVPSDMSRNPDFSAIEPFLPDEQSLLVTLLFDEFASTVTYSDDLRRYYRGFGQDVATLAKWLVQDEGRHFRNFAEILKENHRSELGRVEELLILVTGQGAEYNGTFLLDYTQEKNLPLDFRRVVSEKILYELGIRKTPPGELVSLMASR